MSGNLSVKNYKRSNISGVTVIIINRKRLLLLKRIRFPFIINPGIWSFLSGGRKKEESSLENAYREIEEETRLVRSNLKLLFGPKSMTLFDSNKKIRWQNDIYIFKSDSRRVIKNIENSAYRWASISDIKKHIEYTNIFENESLIITLIEKFLK